MRILLKLSITIAVIITSSLVNAAEDSGLTVVPGIDFGFKQSGNYVTANGSPLPYTVSPNYLTLISSIAIAYGKVYVSMSYDTPLTESHTVFNVPDAKPDPMYSDRAYNRNETTLTLGYRLLPALSVFTGYLKGESKIRQVDYKYVSGVWKPEPKEIAFDGAGYFAGLSTNYSFDSKGTIALSAAYASMEGTQTTLDGLQNPMILKSQSASGYSTSLSWSGPMSESVFYQLGFRYAKYTYNFTNLTIEEPVRGFTFGVRKYF